MENIENDSIRGNQIENLCLNQFNKRVSDEESSSHHKKLKLDYDVRLNKEETCFNMGMLTNILDDILSEAVDISVNKSNKVTCETAVVKQNRKVAYVLSGHLVKQCSRLDKVKNRAMLVHSLLSSYKLLNNLVPIPLVKATEEDLLSFHSSDYVHFLRDPDAERNEEEASEFGLDYDCPTMENMMDLVLTLAGGSISAANSLVEGNVQVAINWCGGWHHAQRDKAVGFCYVNDIVLAIHNLKQKFGKVLYIDLDVHHGDGVENAFSFTNQIFTFSIHKMEPGYFPGTGSQEDIGFGKGQYYTLNIPLKAGVTDGMFCHIFSTILPNLLSSFKPGAVVVQCGADCLTGDPLGGFNITPVGLGRCLSQVLDADLPTLVLGGGGYHLQNTARCWTYLTSVILNKEIDNEIPDCDPFFQYYGPSFELEVTPGCAKNNNSNQQVDEIIKTAVDNIGKITKLS